MTLLEKLAQEEPYVRKRPEVKHPELLEIVRQKFEEITQARKWGYTWKQITSRAIEVWRESGELKTRGCTASHV